MKLQCDVCNKTAASVICSADEAALCDDCDHKVHRANKVASKHLRFSLSESADLHLCDICQEKGGYFVFCQEDRAMLCWNCDDSVHSANKLTMKHSRFLLTGTRISAVSSLEGSCSSINNKLMKSSQEKNSQISDGASSISEYLIKTLPGYRVEDLLDFSVPYKNDVICQEAEERTEVQCPVWVPHAPEVQLSNYTHNNFNTLFSQSYIDLKYNQNENEPMQEASLVQSQGEESGMVPQLNATALKNNKGYRPSSGLYY